MALSGVDGLRIDPAVEDILSRVLEGRELKKEDALQLMDVKIHSPEMYMLMAVADGLTRSRFDNFGEVHAQIGINYAPCLLYTSPSPRDGLLSRMPSSA